jgi:hypothetical protein
MESFKINLSCEFTKVFVLKSSLFTIRRTSMQKPCSEENKLEKDKNKLNEREENIKFQL